MNYMKVQELFENQQFIVKNGQIDDDLSKSVWMTDFICFDIGLTTLKGVPFKVNGIFNCAANELTSLKGSPKEVRNNFQCSNNKLKTLEGAPKEIGGNFFCSHNELITLKGAPERIKFNFFCINNNLTSLQGIHKHIKSIGKELHLEHNPIKSHVLGVLLIEQCIKILLDNIEVQQILNKYLPNTQGREALYDCQEELINAGFEEYAQL